MKFRTKYTERVRKNICSGSGIKKEYAIRIIDGEETLAETGESSLYDYIQSHADSVDIHKILERCAMMDDYSPLMRMPAEFMDVTGMPKTLAEAYAMTKDTENYFNMLPTDIKEKYDNNFLMFLESIGTEKFNDVVKAFIDKEKAKNNVEKEVESE